MMWRRGEVCNGFCVQLQCFLRWLVVTADFHRQLVERFPGLRSGSFVRSSF